jgi:hypothetical protein
MTEIGPWRKSSRSANDSCVEVRLDALPEFIDWFIDAQVRLRAAVEVVRRSSTPPGA